MAKRAAPSTSASGRSTDAGAARGRGRRRGRAVRRPGAPRAAPALGPAAGARRGRRLVGAAEGRAPAPEGEPPRGPHRGPPARVPRPSRARSRRASTGRGRCRSGTAAPTRREKFRDDEVILTFAGERVEGRYALFQTDGDELDDPPHGPAGRPRPGADAERRDQADDGHPGEAPARRRRLGLRAQVGRRAGDRLLRRGPHPPGEPQPARHHLPVPRGAARRPPSSARARSSSTARSSPSTTRAVPTSSASSGACTSAPRPRCAGARRTRPVTYVLFDLLFLEGRDLYDLPYAERRALLDELELDGPAWQTPASHRGDGKALLELTEQRGLEGVVAKRLDSRYLPGQALRRLAEGQERPQPGPRDRRLDARRGPALGIDRRAARRLLRRRTASELLRYAGRVGTGFTEETLRRLRGLLEEAGDRREPLHRPPAAEAGAFRRAPPGRRGRVPRVDRERGPCAPPRSRACATTATRARCASTPATTPLTRTTPVRQNRAREGFGEGGLRGAGDDRARRGGQRGRAAQGRADRRGAGHPDALPREHPLRAAPPAGSSRAAAAPRAATGSAACRRRSRSPR